MKRTEGTLQLSASSLKNDALGAKRIWVVTGSLSVLIHILLLPILLSTEQSSAATLESPQRPTRPLRLLRGGEVKRLLSPPIKKTERPKPKTLPKAPIVTLSRVTEEISDAKARYLASVNNRTARETVSRAKGLPQAMSKRRPRSQTPQQKAATQAKTNRAETRAPNASNSTLNPRKNGAMARQQERMPVASASTTMEQLKGLDTLLHQASVGNETVGHGTPERIDNVEPGSETILNTKQYKHSWFFNRVVGALYQNWRVREAHRQNDPRNQIFGVRDRSTVVEVVLDGEGYLLAIKVVTPSGAPYLDEEAIATFRRAQPFPNPPLELADQDGRIRFRLGFFIDFGTPRFYRVP